jgi:gamma-glutamylcyclotransferase (GGCT)/AIG2-like uncharacterized protein YtfP
MVGKESVVNLAVNGTLMRGLELNGNLQQVGAEFVREATTEPAYRLWSIDDRHPAMQRVAAGGRAIELEVWAVPASGISTLLQLEPPGLCIGKVRLADGEEVLGVLGEAILCEGQPEITRFGGWRAYISAQEQPVGGESMSDVVRDVVRDSRRDSASDGISDSIDPAAFVPQAAALINLPLQPEHRAGVVENFARIVQIAQLVTQFPLPEAIEVAPTFQP